MSLVFYIPLLLLIVLCYRLAQVRAYHSFPLFFAYIVYAVFAGLIRLLVQNFGHLYTVVYWSTEGGYAILGILVLYEVLRAALGNFKHTSWFRILVPGLVLFASCLALLYERAYPQAVDSRMVAVVLGFELWVRLLQGLLFSVLVVLMLLLGIPWRQHLFGIVAGFALYATVYLLITVGFSIFGTNFGFLWGVIEVVAYTAAILIWLWYFRGPERKQPERGYPGGVPAAMRELARYKEIFRKRPW